MRTVYLIVVIESLVIPSGKEFPNVLIAQANSIIEIAEPYDGVMVVN